MIESIQAGIWWNLVDHLSVNFLLPDKYSFAMEGNDPPHKSLNPHCAEKQGQILLHVMPLG